MMLKHLDLNLRIWNSLPVSPDNGQDPSHKTSPEGHGQVELQCPVHRSRLAAAVMVQALNQTEDDGVVTLIHLVYTNLHLYLLKC